MRDSRQYPEQAKVDGPTQSVVGLAENLRRRWLLFSKNPSALGLKKLIQNAHRLRRIARELEHPRLHAYSSALLEAFHHLAVGTRPRSEDARNVEGLISALNNDHIEFESDPDGMTELEMIVQPRRRRLIYILGSDPDWSSDLQSRLGPEGFHVKLFDNFSLMARQKVEDLPLAIICEASLLPSTDDKQASPWNPFRQGRLQVPLLVISESGDFNTRLAAIRSGAIRFFTKPVDGDEVLASVKQLCGGQPQTPFRVLLVDDDRMLTEMYATVLDYEGFEVTRASHPREAIDQLMTEDPDLILLDLYLPICSGIDLAHMIRQYPRFESTPIVFLSVETSLDVQLACARLSGEEFLTKPVEPWRLLMVVESRARRSRLLREENRRLAQRVTYQAEHDALTGLPNRTLFKDRLQQALIEPREEGHKTAVLMLDLDHFHRINDVFGHEAGDQLLLNLARQLADCLREGDTLSRPGGDELLILLPHLDSLETVAEVAQDLLSTTTRISPFESESPRLSCSIGIAVSPHDGTTGDELLKNADTALYHAKQGGRATFAFFTTSMGETLSDQLQLEQDLEQALQQNQLCLDYQPIVGVADNGIAGAEALIRWQHPQRGRLMPMQFIPLAERCGLIGRLGEWVLETACRQLAEWHRGGRRHLSVAVNIAAPQLMDSDLCPLVEGCLQRHRLPPESLTLELTESMLMEDPRRAAGQLRRLRTLGVKIAIDDFGTGYSSLSYMKQLPVDKLKVDKSFLANLEKVDDRQIVQAIIALAHSLHLDVVAEGVETEQQLEYLRAWRCRFFQGYLFSKPTDPAHFIQLASTGGASEEPGNEP